VTASPTHKARWSTPISARPARRALFALGGELAVSGQSLLAVSGQILLAANRQRHADNRDRHLVLQGCYLGWEPLTGFLCRGAGAEVALLPKSSDLAHEVTWLGGVA
jgi:hypothetical protein